MFSLTRFAIRSLSLTTRSLSLSPLFSQQSPTEAHSPPTDPSTKEPMANWDYSVELNAFRNRFAVPLTDISVIQRALTHRSYLEANPAAEGREHNDRYALLGQTVMTHFVMEYFFSKYPNLSSSALRDCHNFIADTPQLVRTARHLGIHELYLTNAPTGESIDAALAEALLAFIGSVHADQGPLYARQLVQEFVLYALRGRDVYGVIKIEQPAQVLREILGVNGGKEPYDELLWETGRDSERPIFCVSVHSGEDRLAEGVGQTIERARHDAYETAVLQSFYKELREFTLPSDLYGTTYSFNSNL